MKIISDREFGNQPGKKGEELADRHTRALMALSSVRGKAMETGLDAMSASEIDDEIKKVRKQRLR